jgi:hypothetical protein
LLLIVVLLILLVIAVDPNARQKAAALVHRWNETVVVNTTDNDADEAPTPIPTRTPVPTATAVADNNDEVIPNTGSPENEPIIQVNWDALQAALRRFWDNLRNIKIDLNPTDNK